MRFLAISLLVIHFTLLIWAVGGFIEMTEIQTFWPAYTNPDFPNWLLPIHWGSVLIGASGFIAGYLNRAKWLPHFMLAAYTMLFTICIIETFGFMSNPTKYLAMTLEFVAYSTILFFLFRNSYFRRYLSSKPQ